MRYNDLEQPEGTQKGVADVEVLRDRLEKKRPGCFHPFAKKNSKICTYLQKNGKMITRTKKIKKSTNPPAGS
jgi:hypothetical protein